MKPLGTKAYWATLLVLWFVGAFVLAICVDYLLCGGEGYGRGRCGYVDVAGSITETLTYLFPVWAWIAWKIAKRRTVRSREH